MAANTSVKTAVTQNESTPNTAIWFKNVIVFSFNNRKLTPVLCLIIDITVKSKSDQKFNIKCLFFSPNEYQC